MAKTVDRLTARGVTAIAKPGRHGDGGGLYLNVTEKGARSWVFLWRRNGRRREMGLGSCRDVSLAEARQAASAARKIVRGGGDPIAERDRQSDRTFGEAAEDLLTSLEGGWKNAKHRQQWRATLTTYCKTLWKTPVGAVSTDGILEVLKPIWQAKPETASRLRGRIERVLDYAAAHGWRSGANPARWRGHLKAILPAPIKLKRGHHRALPFEEVPAFMAQLRSAEGIGARALEYVILTAARSSEGARMEWPELDQPRAVWRVPAERMKRGKAHLVPLSGRAVAILAEMKVFGGRYVFPGLKRGKPVSDGTMTAVLRRLKVPATVHGFRSSFRDWAGDATSYPRELAEHALAHAIGDEAEQAYRRGSAVQRRREMMEAWAAFCEGQSNVVVLAAS